MGELERIDKDFKALEWLAAASITAASPELREKLDQLLKSELEKAGPKKIAAACAR